LRKKTNRRLKGYCTNVHVRYTLTEKNLLKKVKKSRNFS
jgi:hypothetical protein